MRGVDNSSTPRFFVFVSTQKHDVAALTNELYRQGGTIPSGTGVTSGSLSKADVNPAGDGSKCIVPETRDYEKTMWYVMRTTNNRIFKAEDLLSKAGLNVYVPKHYVIKKVFGVRRRFRESLLFGLLFVYSSRREIDFYRKEHPGAAGYIKYYLNKTDRRESNGLNPPMVIENRDMDNFRKACNAADEHTMQIDPKTVRFKSNDEVLVIGGDFTGVRGRVVRIAGQQRVAVILNDTIGIATAYIPSAFLEVIKTND